MTKRPATGIALATTFRYPSFHFASAFTSIISPNEFADSATETDPCHDRVTRMHALLVSGRGTSLVYSKALAKPQCQSIAPLMSCPLLSLVVSGTEIEIAVDYLSSERLAIWHELLRAHD